LNGVLGIQALLGVLASFDLLDKFAMKPLVSDIKAFMALGEHVNIQLDRLAAGVPIHNHGTFAEKLSGSRIGSMSSSNGMTSQDTYEVNWDATRVYTATEVVRINPGPNLTEFAVALASVRSNQVATAAYEITPWSFLLNYFLDVGNWLNQFETQDMFTGSTTTRLDSGWSKKTTITIKGEHRFGAAIGTVDPVVGSLESSEYIRTPTLPLLNVNPLPDFRLPTRQQWETIAALAISRLSGLKLH